MINFNRISYFLLWCVIAGLMFVNCDSSPFAPANNATTIKLRLENPAASGGRWLSQIMGEISPPQSKVSGRSGQLSKIAAIDEVKILVLDLTRWENENEFLSAWEDANQTDSLVPPDFNNGRDFYDNAVTLFQSYTGEFYRFAGEFNLAIEAGRARGTITANPGLNYFLVAFRETGATLNWVEAFFIVRENEENSFCICSAPPVVEITTPPNGSAVNASLIIVSGTISDDTVSTATLSVNNSPQTIPADSGAFSAIANLSAGANVVIVSAGNAGGVGADTVVVVYNPPPVPGVVIDSPAEGSIFDGNVITVSGTVSEDTITTVSLFLGDFEQTIPVSQGAFSNAVVLSVGINTIVVQARNTGGVGSDTVNVEFQGQPAALRVTLIWDTNDTDMDLRMLNPSGQECSFLNPVIGGMTLDVDDANGFGPENISVNQPINGNYTIRVVNFSASQGFGTTATVYIFKNEALIDTQMHTFSAADVNNTWEVGIYAWP